MRKPIEENKFDYFADFLESELGLIKMDRRKGLNPRWYGVVNGKFMYFVEWDNGSVNYSWHIYLSEKNGYSYRVLPNFEEFIERYENNTLFSKFDGE